MRNTLNEVLENSILKLKLSNTRKSLPQGSHETPGSQQEIPLSLDGIDLVGLALCHRMEK